MGFQKERRPLLTPNNADVAQDLRVQFDDVAAVGTTNAADIATNVTGIADNVTDIATNVTDIAAVTTGLSYSTSEVNTGLTWTDAKAIFSKTVDLGALPNAVPGNVAHGITTIETLIRLEGMAKVTATEIRAPLPFSQIGGNEDIQIQVDLVNIIINPGAENRSNMTGSITLYYTKTA